MKNFADFDIQQFLYYSKKEKMGYIYILEDEDSKESLDNTLVYLDGEFLSKLEKRGNLKFKVQAGKHTIKLKQGMFVSPGFEVNIKDFDEITILIGTNYKRKSNLNTLLIPVIFFGGLLYNTYYLKSATFLWTILGCTALLLIFESYRSQFKGMLYYMTVGRKKYFNLQILKRK